MDKIKIKIGKVLENGKIRVNVPDKESEIKLKRSLKTTFSDRFYLDEVKKKSCQKLRTKIFRKT